MRLLFRFLTFLGIPGCLYWIKTNPGETEPLVAFIASLAAFASTFIAQPKAVITFAFTKPNSNGRLTMANLGEADASDIAIQFIGASPHPRDVADFPKHLGPKEQFHIVVPLAFDLPTTYVIECSWKSEGHLFRTKRQFSVSLQA